MKLSLSLRLAIQNLRRHASTYGPFLIAAALLTFAVYSFLLLQHDPGLGALLTGSITFSLTLLLGSVVIVAFTWIFLFYANSFLIRRRKQELGLYGILGMERRHIFSVMLFEMLVLLLMILLAGIGLGVLLARLLFLILRVLTETEIPLTIGFHPLAMLKTAALMGLLFLLLLIYNAVQIKRTKPVDLLQAAHQAEKEPRARWLLAIIGAACMATGYWIALTVNNDQFTAMEDFFKAVLLVIIGTYLLFMTGSIAVLKLLQRCKSIYYRPQRFVIISGMLYRMKQNAAGLASICILITMAMITLGTTSALFLGKEDAVETAYVADVLIRLEHPDDQQAILNALPSFDAQIGTTRRNQYTYRSYHTFMYQLDGVLRDKKAFADYIQQGSLDASSTLYHYVVLMPQDDFNTMQGTNLSLQDNEIACFSSIPRPESMVIAGQTWQLLPIEQLSVAISSSGEANTVLVAPDWETVIDIAHSNPMFTYEETEGLNLDYCIRFDINGSLTERVAYSEAFVSMVPRTLREAHHGNVSGYGYGYTLKANYEQEWNANFGMFLYTGIFLGIIFLLGTALILYFKQISEGHQDRERYVILQKVGMGQKEVRQSVRRQMLLVFFLPLAVAMLHVLGSMEMVRLLISMFSLENRLLTTSCTLISALIVALIYLMFYWKTARTYYKLVRFD